MGRVGYKNLFSSAHVGVPRCAGIGNKMRNPFIFRVLKICSSENVT